MKKTKRIVISALFTALSLSLFTIELLIPPFPFCPGAKIGLANIVTLYMISNNDFFRNRDAFCVLLVRCFLAAVLTGRLMSILFSFTGGVVAFAGMLIVRRFLGSGYVVCASIAGAVFHNLGQIIVAIIVYGTNSAFYLIPTLFIAGVLCGVFTGLCVKLINRLKLHNRLI